MGSNTITLIVCIIFFCILFASIVYFSIRRNVESEFDKFVIEHSPRLQKVISAYDFEDDFIKPENCEYTYYCNSQEEYDNIDVELEFKKYMKESGIYKQWLELDNFYNTYERTLSDLPGFVNEKDCPIKDYEKFNKIERKLDKKYMLDPYNLQFRWYTEVINEHNDKCIDFEYDDVIEIVREILDEL